MPNSHEVVYNYVEDVDQNLVSQRRSLEDGDSPQTCLTGREEGVATMTGPLRVPRLAMETDRTAGGKEVAGDAVVGALSG